jgi:hypothetical protein
MNEDNGMLMDELANLLERQIALARRGSLAQVERLAGKCEQLVARITADGLPGKPEQKERREQLAKLYQELQLMLSTQKADAAEQMKSVGKGKRTLAIYRGNI